MIENKNSLDADVKVTILLVKTQLTIWLMDQKRAKRILLKHAKTNLRKKELRSEIEKLVSDNKSLRRYRNRFSLFGGNRGHDIKWASHLKEHLTRSILAEEITKLPKRLSPQAIAKKNALLREFDRKNAETMKRARGGLQTLEIEI